MKLKRKERVITWPDGTEIKYDGPTGRDNGRWIGRIDGLVDHEIEALMVEVGKSKIVSVEGATIDGSPLMDMDDWRDVLKDIAPDILCVVGETLLGDAFAAYGLTFGDDDGAAEDDATEDPTGS